MYFELLSIAIREKSLAREWIGCFFLVNLRGVWISSPIYTPGISFFGSDLISWQDECNLPSHLHILYQGIQCLIGYMPSFYRLSTVIYSTYFPIGCIASVGGWESSSWKHFKKTDTFFYRIFLSILIW